MKQVQEVDLTSRITDEEKQIKDYGGFYIARYEAGIPESLPDAIEPDPIPDDEKLKELRSVSGIPVSKKNQVPWNNIDYKQAKENAEKMYTGDKVKSGLLTGKMWDTTLQWLIKTNAVTNYEVNTDGSSWGNYGTSLIPGITSYSKYIGRQTGIQWIEGITTKYRINEDKTEKSEYCWLLKTGNTEYTKRNNIYDLAGNLWEFTYERYKTSDNSLDAVDRGYSFQVENNISPGSIRSHVSIEHYGSDIGFRVALYIS